MRRLAYWAAGVVVLHWVVKFLHDDELAWRAARRLYGDKGSA